MRRLWRLVRARMSRPAVVVPACDKHHLVDAKFAVFIGRQVLALCGHCRQAQNEHIRKMGYTVVKIEDVPPEDIRMEYEPWI